MPAETKTRATLSLPRAIHMRLANAARLLDKSIQLAAEEAVREWLDRNRKLTDKRIREVQSL